MKKLFAPLLALAFLLAPNLAHAGALTQGCFPIVWCPAGQDSYGGACQPELDTVSGAAPSCLSVNGAPDPGKFWAFSCNAGCYQKKVNVPAPPPSCPGGIEVSGECLIKLDILDDDVHATNPAYKVFDGADLTEIVHVDTTGCADNEVAVSDSTSPTGWRCSVQTGVWQSNANGIHYDAGVVGIGTASPVVFSPLTLEATGTQTRGLKIMNDKTPGLVLDFAAHNGPDPTNTDLNIAMNTNGKVIIRSEDEAILGAGNKNTGTLIIGPFAGAPHMQIDGDEITVADGGGNASDLLLQPHGGTVAIGVSNPTNTLEVGGAADLNGNPLLGVTNIQGTSPDGIKFFPTDVSGQAMHIDQSNMVGIGINDPTAKLHVNNFNATGTLLEVARFERQLNDITNADEGGYITLGVKDGNNNPTARISWRNNGTGGVENETELGFWTQDGTLTEHMTIKKDGDVGIGTTTPNSGADLHVVGRVDSGMFCDETHDVCANPRNGSWLHVRTKADDAYKGLAASKVYAAEQIGVKDSTPAGLVDVNTSSNTEGYWLESKAALTANDNWLRLNQSKSFTSGTYTPGILRTDDGLRIENLGSSEQEAIRIGIENETAAHIIMYDDDAKNTQHFKMEFSADTTDLAFHSDEQTNILYLEKDGRVGVGGLTPHTTAAMSVRNAGYIPNADHGLIVNSIMGGGDGLRATGPRYGVWADGSGSDFYANGGTGSTYSSGSSVRWKSNVEKIPNALDKVLQLEGVYFDWDEAHGGGHDMGMIAEEVGKVVPEVVAFEDDSEYAYGMDYGRLTPVLTEAIKELKAEKDAEIAALKEIVCEDRPDSEFCN